jgi:hypothetical protein
MNKNRCSTREDRLQTYYGLGIFTLESTGNTLNDILALVTDIIHAIGTAVESIYIGLARGEIVTELSKILGRFITEGVGALGVALGSLVRGLMDAIKNFMEVMKAGGGGNAGGIFSGTVPVI